MSAGAVGTQQPVPTAGGVMSNQRQEAIEMAMHVDRRDGQQGKTVRFVFLAEPAYAAAIDALRRLHMVNTSTLLRRLVVDEAQRNGIVLAEMRAEVDEDAGAEEELEAA